MAAMKVKSAISDKLAARNPQKALVRAGELKTEGAHERAFKLYTIAAKAGIAEAQLELGLYYYSGDAGGLSSALESARWLTRAAEQGNVTAQRELAVMYASGLRSENVENTLFLSSTEETGPDFTAALRWGLKAAAAGSADAQALCGFIYVTGPEALRDPEQAKYWYGKAAEADNAQGHLGIGIIELSQADNDEMTFSGVSHMKKAAAADLPAAHYYMGAIHESATGVAQDYGLAAHHYGLAAKAGIRDAQARYGFMQLKGIGLKANTLEGETWLRRAALAGDTAAAAAVADIYAHGDEGLPPNYAEAAIWFRAAAEGGHRPSARALGMLYLLGSGVPRDGDEAAKWLRLAAEAGDQVAQADLATLLLKKQINPRITTPPPVFDWFEKAAETGDMVGAYNYAMCLAEGVGVERDDVRAAEWFHRAASTVLNARYRYARFLMEGRGVAQDFAAAREWLQPAVDLELPEALLDLAALNVQGLGGPRNDEAARQLFERAAAKGTTEAMFALGALYGGGYEIPTDRATSLAWYRQAAEAGHPRAALMLGKYLRLGIATAPDPEAARKWLTLAKKSGLAEAQEELAALDPPAAAE